MSKCAVSHLGEMALFVSRSAVYGSARGSAYLLKAFGLRVSSTKPIRGWPMRGCRHGRTDLRGHAGNRRRLLRRLLTLGIFTQGDTWDDLRSNALCPRRRRWRLTPYS